MKDTAEVVACVVDYGSFVSMADALAKSFERVYYYSPFEEEFQNVHKCVIGDGIPGFERMDEFLDPPVLDSIDLFVFPDIGFTGLQRHLRSLGKAVWGSMGACELELYRTRFLEVLRQAELPVVKSIKLRGITKVAQYLKSAERKWVKINRYRANMETWFHLDWVHSQRKLEEMAVTFGGVREEVVFVVQDEIEPAKELGYDGWCVDGKYPPQSFQGYEKKNELYLGSLLDNEDLPEQVLWVNEAMAPILERYGYRNHIATELRITEDGEHYFIDPTMRMPGQTGEHQFNTCTNLAEVIWKGSRGEIVAPEFDAKYAMEATLHYSGETEWKTLNIPEDARPFFKGYHYCMVDGVYHFPPHKTDEVGVIIGSSDESIEDAFENLQEHIAMLGDEPVSAKIEGFAELLEDIKAAEKEGIHFADGPIPEPEIVLSGNGSDE